MNRICSALLLGFAVSLGASCDSEPIAEPEFRPPEAEAGPYQRLRDMDGNGSELVVLDGSASRRGSRQIVRFEWTEAGVPLIGVSSDDGRTLHVDVAVGHHLFILKVTDDTGVSDSDMVSIEVRAPDPVVSIVWPGHGTVHATGRDLQFQGRAVDQHESLLTGSRLVWTSSLDGEIGTGVSFARGDLSRGDHVIMLQATDRDGFVGSTRVEIALIDPPIATILKPDDGRSFYWAEDVDLEGTCSDPGGEAAGELKAAWRITGERSIGGVLQTVLAFVSPGTHVVTLVCVDDRGVTGEASATIDVVVSFGANIQPMLESLGCLRCHSGIYPAGGVGLDSYEAITAGGNGNGPLIVPGDATQGTLIGQLVWEHELSEPEGFPYPWWGWDPYSPYVPFPSWWAVHVLAWWIDAGVPNN